jgi:ubiquitin C-terminal hydrolase
MQCLSNTPGLTQYFVESKYVDEINTNNPLGWGGKIAQEYAKLIKDIWSGKYTTVAPRGVKDAIGEFQPRFSGYQQHDSSELLSFLMGNNPHVRLPQQRLRCLCLTPCVLRCALLRVLQTVCMKI